MRINTLASRRRLRPRSLGGAIAQDRVVNVYNWSDYIDEDVLERLHQGDRHQGRLRRLRQQRDPRDQAARRRLRLRHRRADRLQHVAPDPGRRRCRSSTSRSCPNLVHMWPLIIERLADLRSRQRVLGQLHVGHDRHRLQRRQGQGAPRHRRDLDTWDIIFKPENAAKLADCGIYVLDAPDDIIPTTLAYLGLNPDSKDPADIEKAGELLQGDPPLHPEVPLVGIHQRARQWRHLPGGRLFGRHPPGARPRRRGQQRRRDRLPRSRRKARRCGSTASSSRPTRRISTRRTPSSTS